jgi:3-hydroxyacyl-CoA dehydrogenase/enoyl-CoA hydratase/3-hydroxybutyryl-CoA epimerase
MLFFSPVEKMPLLEVLPHEGTAPDAVVTAVRFGRKLGKTVIVVRDHPGFWVNRILSPYLNEAGIMVEEGVPIDLIDRTMTKFGFPVGPVALMDEVGLDVAQKAAKVMHEAFGDRLKPSPALERMIADDRMGRKNQRGFYAYSGGHKSGVDERVYRLLGIRPLDGFDAADIERRLVHIMLNEAAMACGEDVVRSARDGDIGALFGIGFPPFRGGPLRMIDDLSATIVVDTLRQLADAHGPRFTPAPALVARAATGNRYYSES